MGAGKRLTRNATNFPACWLIEFDSGTPCKKILQRFIAIKKNG